MSTALTIAFRYLFSSKSTNAINIISYISMIGMGLGAMVLVVLLSVFNGFEDLVIQLQGSFYADIEINKTEGKVFNVDEGFTEKLNQIDGLEAFALVLEENAYVSYDGKSAVAKIRAYDENFDEVNTIGEYMIKGSSELKEDEKNFALLGAGIYYNIGASNNQPISIAIPIKGTTNAITAAQLFNSAQIFPGGVFGIQNEFDNSYIITSIDFLRKLQGFKNEVSSVELKIKEGFNENQVAEAALQVLGPDFETTTRVQQNKSLYKAMQAEKYAMIAILFLVLLIISFTIVGALSMLAMEKKLDISILKAMGASDAFVFKVFLYQGIIGSLIGATIGAVLGILVVAAQQVFGLVTLGGNGGFVIEAYPVKLEAFDVLIAFVLITIISFLASWLPASRAAKGDMLFVKY
jgi:lipoprotein-releasing system permease protein